MNDEPTDDEIRAYAEKEPSPNCRCAFIGYGRFPRSGNPAKGVVESQDERVSWARRFYTRIRAKVGGRSKRTSPL